MRLARLAAGGGDVCRTREKARKKREISVQAGRIFRATSTSQNVHPALIASNDSVLSRSGDRITLQKTSEHRLTRVELHLDGLEGCRLPVEVVDNMSLATKRRKFLTVTDVPFTSASCHSLN